MMRPVKLLMRSTMRPMRPRTMLMMRSTLLHSPSLGIASCKPSANAVGCSRLGGEKS